MRGACICLSGIFFLTSLQMWENILSTTQVGYVDLLLLHWPG